MYVNVTTIKSMSEEKYKARIRELELEIKAREADLSHFRAELVKTNEKLETLIANVSHQLRVAHAVQKVLVPTEIPNIQGFEFSSKFIASYKSGGDYFDIFEHEDRLRFGIFLASSSGYAMSALLLSVLLKLTGELEARRSSDPGLVVQKIATELHANMSDKDQADLFYGVVDRRTFEMSYCRLGQVGAAIYRSKSTELEPLHAPGETVAIGHDGAIETHRVVLNPRDRLILCTRGLIDSRNLAGECYGGDRFFRSIVTGPKEGPHDLRNHLLYEVEKHSQGVELERDLTVVVSEVNDRVIKLAKN